MIAVLARQLLREGALAVGAEPRAEDALRHGRVRPIQADAGEAGPERRCHGLLDAGPVARRDQAGAELARRTGRAAVGGAARLVGGEGMAGADIGQRLPRHAARQGLVEADHQRVRRRGDGDPGSFLREYARWEPVGREGGLDGHEEGRRCNVQRASPLGQLRPGPFVRTILCGGAHPLTEGASKYVNCCVD
ncbi:MAG TPA: hypothetical protein VF805_02690 [Anaeromyxobacteraceae bacterium]